MISDGLKYRCEELLRLNSEGSRDAYLQFCGDHAPEIARALLKRETGTMAERKYPSEPQAGRE